MKKIIFLSLVIVFCFCLISCDKKENNPQGEIEIEATENYESEENVTPEDEIITEFQQIPNKEDDDFTEEEWQNVMNAVARESQTKEIKTDEANASGERVEKVKRSDRITAIYYMDGEKIVGYEVRVSYDSGMDAQLAKNSFVRTPNDYIKSVTTEGSDVIIKYEEAKYINSTIDEIEEFDSEIAIKL